MIKYLAESLELMVDAGLRLVVVVEGVVFVERGRRREFCRRRVLPVEGTDREAAERPPQFERHPGGD